MNTSAIDIVTSTKKTVNVSRFYNANRLRPHYKTFFGKTLNQKSSSSWYLELFINGYKTSGAALFQNIPDYNQDW